MQTAHLAILVAAIAVLGAASYLCVPGLGLGLGPFGRANAAAAAAAAAATDEALNALEKQLSFLQQDMQNKIAIANMVAAQQEAKIQQLANSLYGNILRRAQQQQPPALQAGPPSAPTPVPVPTLAPAPVPVPAQ